MKQPSRKLDEKTSATIAIQLCKALGYLHARKIIHRDIKPENILLDANDNVKVADFGWSNFEEKFKKRETYCGTVDYLAPEMADHSHKHDHRVDIWSVGILIFELLTGSAPFTPNKPGASSSDLEIETKRNILRQKFDFPRDFPPLAKDLVKKILVLRPEDRLSIEQILCHPWLSRYFAESPDKSKLQKAFTPESSANLGFSQYIKKIVQVNDVHMDGSYIKNEYTFNPDELDRFVRPDLVILRSDLIQDIPNSQISQYSNGGLRVLDKPREVNLSSQTNYLSTSGSSSPLKTMTPGTITQKSPQFLYPGSPPGGASNSFLKPQLAPQSPQSSPSSHLRSASQQRLADPSQPQPTISAIRIHSRGNSPSTKTQQSSARQGIPPVGPLPLDQRVGIKHLAKPQPQSAVKPQGGGQTCHQSVAESQTLDSSRFGSQMSTTQSGIRPATGDWSLELLKAKEKISELSREVSRKFKSGC